MAAKTEGKTVAPVHDLPTVPAELAHEDHEQSTLPVSTNRVRSGRADMTRDAQNRKRLFRRARLNERDQLGRLGFVRVTHG